MPVIFVEAEKSVLAGTAWADRNNQRVLFVGTGGCWAWRGKIGTKGKSAPLPDLNLITWPQRKAIILFDSNTAANPNVQQARACFATELRARGAQVVLANLPQRDNLNGPDDLIALLGDDALADVLNNAVPFADDWRKELLLSQNGAPRPLLSNAVVMLRHAPEWQGVLAFNEFSLYAATARPAPWRQSVAGAIWTDDDDSRTACWLQQNGIFVNSKVAAEAVQVIARENPFHPVKRYLTGLVWDQQPRIEA